MVDTLDIEALTGGDATDFGNVVRSYVNTSESITSGAAPVVADPDVAFTLWTTGGTKGTETVTLADPSDPTKAAFKTFAIKAVQSADVPTLSIDNTAGFSSPIIIGLNSLTAIVELCWNPALSAWQILVGGASGTFTSVIVVNGIVISGT